MATNDQDSKLQVIVAGLPRTGTTSMSSALRILLKGDVFDGGQTSFSGTPDEQRKLLDLAGRCPMKTEEDRQAAITTLADLTRNCVASSDQPGCFFLAELLTLYPSAKVIVTTRQRSSWWSSYTTLWSSITSLYYLSILSPPLWRFCRFSVIFWDRVVQALELPSGCENYFDLGSHERVWEAHMRYLTRVVPADQLFYFDVRDGWEPLCEILGSEIPDVPFPHEFRRGYLNSATGELKRKLWLRLILLTAVLASIGSLFLHFVR